MKPIEQLSAKERNDLFQYTADEKKIDSVASPQIKQSSCIFFYNAVPFFGTDNFDISTPSNSNNFSLAFMPPA